MRQRLFPSRSRRFFSVAEAEAEAEVVDELVAGGGTGGDVGAVWELNVGTPVDDDGGCSAACVLAFFLGLAFDAVGFGLAPLTPPFKSTVMALTNASRPRVYWEEDGPWDVGLASSEDFFGRPRFLDELPLVALV